VVKNQRLDDPPIDVFEDGSASSRGRCQTLERFEIRPQDADVRLCAIEWILVEWDMLSPTGTECAPV
jgi:hypothetical protein